MAIALVTSATAGGNNSATTSGVDTTGATLLLIAVMHYNSGSSTPTISDSKGNTWTQAPSAYNTGSAFLRYFYVANPSVGSAHTFTSTLTGGAQAVVAMAFSGVTTTSPYATQQGFGSAGTQTVAGIGASALVPPEDNCLVVAACGLTGGVSGYTAGSGFTVVNFINFSSGVNYGCGATYQVQTTATTIGTGDTTSSWTTAQNVAMSGIVFKSGAPPVTTSVLTAKRGRNTHLLIR